MEFIGAGSVKDLLNALERNLTEGKLLDEIKSFDFFRGNWSYHA